MQEERRAEGGYRGLLGQPLSTSFTLCASHRLHLRGKNATEYFPAETKAQNPLSSQSQKKKWHKQSSDSAAKEWEARVGSPKSRPPRTRDYISQGFLWVREAGPTAFLLSPGEEWLSGRGAGFVAASERKSRYGGGSSGAGVRGGGQSAIGPVVAAGPEPEDISPTGGERTGAS